MSPTAARSRQAILDAAARLLSADHSAGLADIAAAAGVGRSTLHRLFPGREDLLRALATDAIQQVARAYAAAGPGEGSGAEALGRVIATLLPMGDRFAYLLREPSLDRDPAVDAALREVDAPLHAVAARGQVDGSLRRDVPSWWVVDLMGAAVYAAWEAVADGRLAPRDAPALVTAAVLRGVGA